MPSVCFLQGRSLHDHHHWSDLPPRMPGEKSVASSLAAENASVVDAVEVEEGVAITSFCLLSCPSVCSLLCSAGGAGKGLGAKLWYGE